MTATSRHCESTVHRMCRFHVLTHEVEMFNSDKPKPKPKPNLTSIEKNTEPQITDNCFLTIR